MIDPLTRLLSQSRGRVHLFNRKRRVRAIALSDAAHLDRLTASGRPVLLDFFQHGCAPCRVMDGIVDELAAEFGEGAHVVKVNVAHAPALSQRFKIRSTPTFVVVSGRAKAGRDGAVVTQRWRASGLVKKDQLARILTSNGATRS